MPLTSRRVFAVKLSCLISSRTFFNPGRFFANGFRHQFSRPTLYQKESEASLSYVVSEYPSVVYFRYKYCSIFEQHQRRLLFGHSIGQNCLQLNEISEKLSPFLNVDEQVCSPIKWLSPLEANPLSPIKSNLSKMRRRIPRQFFISLANCFFTNMSTVESSLMHVSKSRHLM